MGVQHLHLNNPPVLKHTTHRHVRYIPDKRATRLLILQLEKDKRDNTFQQSMDELIKWLGDQ